MIRGIAHALVESSFMAASFSRLCGVFNCSVKRLSVGTYPQPTTRGKTAIDSADRPATTRSLTVEFRSLGLAEGMTVIVHSSLSRLGWIAGGARAVVDSPHLG